ncbi:MAG TPA: hypothetical protein VKU01_29215 [Bryobacteraceae bacterium]|nr:hypothetical protein [Bryobacteraceae bacterium]
MPLKLFLSYSLDPAAMSVARCLQAFVEAYGAELLVPFEGSTRAVHKAISSSNYVLALIASELTPNARNELDYALEKHKLILPIVRSDLKRNPFFARLPRVFTFSSNDDPTIVEAEVLVFLKASHVIKEEQNTLSALAAVSLNLLQLVSLEDELNPNVYSFLSL